ncbi:MAG: maltose ABC transporter substrate-binding protein [Thermaerobacter sp.]|nr:maltose ABC transporter substrate-binding protein [Thermaerobacter sp.]
MKWQSGAAAVLLTGSLTMGTAAVSAAQASAATHGKVVVWSYLTKPEVKVLQHEAALWAKKTGNQAQVIYEPGTNFQQFATAAHSGQGPNLVFGIPDDNLGTFHAAGLLARVPSGEIKTSQYPHSALSATQYDGKQYAIPLDLETYALFYNKKLVPKPPATFTQLIADAKKLNAQPGRYGFEYDINNFYFSYAFISGFGGYVFQNKKGHLNPNNVGLDNQGAIRGLAFIRSFVTDGLMPSDITGNIAVSNFSAGKLGMIIDGPWDISTYQKAHLHFGIEPLPTLPNGHHPGSFFGTQSAFVSAVAAPGQQKLAWSLAKYLVAHTTVGLLRTGNRIPALASAQPQAIKENPYLTPFIKQSKWAQPMPNIAQMSAVWTPGANALTEVTKGAETPRKAAVNMVKEIKAGIAQLQ